VDQRVRALLAFDRALWPLSDIRKHFVDAKDTPNANARFESAKKIK
jgi:hypothetical protein